MLTRSRPLQIYFKPGLKEDDLMLRVWDACAKDGRPQHIFRTMLRAGLIAMVEAGDLPDSVIEECGLDALVERRRRRVSRHAEKTAVAYPPPAYPHPGYPAPAVPAPYAPYYPSETYPADPPYQPYQPRRQASEPPAREETRPEERPRPAEAAVPRTASASPEVSVDPAQAAPPPAATASDGSEKPRRKLGSLM